MIILGKELHPLLFCNASMLVLAARLTLCGKISYSHSRLVVRFSGSHYIYIYFYVKLFVYIFFVRRKKTPLGA